MSEKTEQPDYEALQKHWEEEVKSNPKTQAFLEPYKQSDWASLYKQYAFSKMLASKHATYYRMHNERQRNQWINAAQEHLCIIQQKKLFDAQCKWRAGLETYEGVDICYDFHVLEHDVMNCHFLEQPSSFDIDLYCEYLTKDNNLELECDGFNEWQNYEELKEAYATNEKNINFPSWYEFHNSRTGNGILLTLPDVRGKLERWYIDLGIKDKQKNQPPAPPYIPPPDADKPYLNYYDKHVHLDLAKQIENKEMVNIFKEYVEATEHRSIWENERAEEDFNYLSEIKDELVPIEAHQDYRVALYLACQKYRCKKIAEHLPLALELYQTNQQLKKMGIDSYEEKEDYQFNLRIRKMYADNILLGRRVNNEPLDFNF
ncbi:hypothetical protein CHRY9390_02355 [Chryseobacterium aquaeductus]|uniref:Uncharacterized protein n=1 Tax=Chryseobacterium aquaeductus TaxID=2675056 RepID=A0A9N8MPG1_9FLAO|nr:hypothetical protein [Chryseobacterium aquaeductus]CAA7331642.1 hypothetical protein CHRY9390_02355 [Chryseobacterium potabilaquae]CAD7811431.1 hypothetical protein CHRY9390_02355 [Chryseobacterium aquaeductus]